MSLSDLLWSYMALYGLLGSCVAFYSLVSPFLAVIDPNSFGHAYKKVCFYRARRRSAFSLLPTGSEKKSLLLYKLSTFLSNLSFILSGRACQDDPGQTKSVDQDESEEKSDHNYSYVVHKVNYTE